MINAFKKIRLSNGVLISGYEGKVHVEDFGALAFSSELDSLSGHFASEVSSVEGSVSSLVDLTDSLLSGQNEANLFIEELQSGVDENSQSLSVVLGDLEIIQSGIADLTQSDSFISQRIDILESGFDQNDIAFSEALDLISGNVDLLSIDLATTNENIDTVSGDLVSLTFNVNNAISGLNTVSSDVYDLTNTIEVQAVEIDYLKTGVDGCVDVLLSHQERLSGIDAAILDLYSGAGLGDNSTKSFSYSIPSGVEDITVPFPGSIFPSIPRVNITLESEVGYLFALKNKTVSGFDISFSDIIQEDNVSVDVTASVQA